MFNGNKVIDADGHVMEPNELYDEYIDGKFKPQLDELKKIASTRASKYFFGYFHQLNTGRPLGVAAPEKPLTRTGRRPHGERPDIRGGFDPHVRIKDMDRARASTSPCCLRRWCRVSARSTASISKSR
jgi:hypothetical protein